MCELSNGFISREMWVRFFPREMWVRSVCLPSASDGCDDSLGSETQQQFALSADGGSEDGADQQRVCEL